MNISADRQHKVYILHAAAVVCMERFDSLGVITETLPSQHMHMFTLDQLVHPLDEELNEKDGIQNIENR